MRTSLGVCWGDYSAYHIYRRFPATLGKSPLSSPPSGLQTPSQVFLVFSDLTLKSHFVYSMGSIRFFKEPSHTESKKFRVPPPPLPNVKTQRKCKFHSGWSTNPKGSVPEEKRTEDLSAGGRGPFHNLQENMPSFDSQPRQSSPARCVSLSPPPNGAACLEGCRRG